MASWNMASPKQREANKQGGDKIQIVITDFDNPTLPLPLKIFNSVGDLCPSRFPPVDVLLSMATKRSGGLTNFGDDAFLEPLTVLVNALRLETPLHAFGRFIQRESIVGSLVARLRLEELYRLHPEIEHERIERPIIIAGLPRTGTTHLFNLLSQDPTLEWIPYWETRSPFPTADEKDPHGRMKIGAQSLKIVDWAMPNLAALHEMHNDWPHEELQLLLQSFTCLQFESSMLLPSYSNWYKQANRSPAYSYLKRCLKALQYLRRKRDNNCSSRKVPKRWLLKCPEHLANIPHLVHEFPCATFVQTHRDPVRIVASMSVLVGYTSRMSLKAGYASEVARHWSTRTVDLLRSSVEDRRYFPKGQICDVMFDDFMRDMKGTVRRIFQHANHQYTIDMDRNIDAFLANNPPGKHGQVNYQDAIRCLGISEEEIKSRL